MSGEVSQPKVSCLLVALPDPDRFALFRRSVGAYLGQSYANRELVMVLDQGPARQLFCTHINDLGRSDIRVYLPDAQLSLGSLRNYGLECVRGDYFCQWDDDDISHPNRLERQLQSLVDDGAVACYLQDVLHFFVDAREVYWTNWCHTPTGCHQATLLCRSDMAVRYPDSGPRPEARSGEDDVFCRQLLTQHKVSIVKGQPELYLYVYHGLNAMGPAHHSMLATSLAVSKGRIARHKQPLCIALRDLGISSPSVTVVSREGAVFSFDDNSR